MEYTRDGLYRNFLFDEERFKQILSKWFPRRKLPRLTFEAERHKKLAAEFSPFYNTIRIWGLKYRLDSFPSRILKWKLAEDLLHELGHWRDTPRLLASIDKCTWFIFTLALFGLIIPGLEFLRWTMMFLIFSCSIVFFGSFVLIKLFVTERKAECFTAEGRCGPIMTDIMSCITVTDFKKIGPPFFY